MKKLSGRLRRQTCHSAFPSIVGRTSAKYHLLLVSFLPLFVIPSENIAAATQPVDVSITLVEPAYRGRTVKAQTVLQTQKKLGAVLLKLFLDEKPVASREIDPVRPGETKTTFGLFLPRNSYLGEHYLRAEVSFRLACRSHVVNRVHSFQLLDPRELASTVVPLLILTTLLGLSVLFPIMNELTKFFWQTYELSEDTRRYVAQTILTIFPVFFTVSAFYLGQKAFEGYIQGIWPLGIVLLFGGTLLWDSLILKYTYTKPINRYKATRCTYYTLISLFATLIWILAPLLPISHLVVE